jgi:hypothetical protein
VLAVGTQLQGRLAVQAAAVALTILVLQTLPVVPAHWAKVMLAAGQLRATLITNQAVVAVRVLLVVTLRLQLWGLAVMASRHQLQVLQSHALAAAVAGISTPLAVLQVAQVVVLQVAVQVLTLVRVLQTRVVVVVVVVVVLRMALAAPVWSLFLCRHPAIPVSQQVRL